MSKTFPSSKNMKEKAGDVLNFITCCLTILPEKRPNADQLQSHRLFGGILQNVSLEPHEDIWSKKGEILNSFLTNYR